MNAAVPTLSSRGWIRSAAEKADYLMAHFFESDHFQTYLYGDAVASLPYLTEQYGNDPLTFCNKLQQTLQVYLGNYFDTVEVEATSDDNPSHNDAPNLTNTIKVRLWARVTQEGKEYSLVKLIETANSKLVKVLNLNNYGTA